MTDSKKEYFDISEKKGLPPRCPLLEHCERRAHTLALANDWPLEDAVERADLIAPIISSVGESAYFIGGTNNFILGGQCPEVYLFDTMRAVIGFSGVPMIKGQYDKYSVTPYEVLETGHFSECAEYMIYSHNQRQQKNIQETLPAPDFLSLGFNEDLCQLLSSRWIEAQQCINTGAYLSAIIMMGGLLEGVLIGMMEKHQSRVNQSKKAPIDNRTGKVKSFREWSLSDMINMAHDIGWLNLDVKSFAHSLREFRNFVHVYEQRKTNVTPDGDTCKISWAVVQAAVNDIARNHKTDLSSDTEIH